MRLRTSIALLVLSVLTRSGIARADDAGAVDAGSAQDASQMVTECPADQAGAPCGDGTCVPGTCWDLSEQHSRDCAACLPPDGDGGPACSQSPGACGDGNLCMPNGAVGVHAAAPDGGVEWFDFVIWNCQPAPPGYYSRTLAPTPPPPSPVPSCAMAGAPPRDRGIGQGAFGWLAAAAVLARRRLTSPRPYSQRAVRRGRRLRPE